LPRGEGPDGFARKGFAIADIELPSGSVIHVVNTHLQADDANVPGDACRRARAAQIANLSVALKPLLEGGEPVLLCGDFNVAHDSDEYASLEAAVGAGLSNLAVRAGLSTYDVARNDLAAIFHSGGPTRALIDYIWASARHFGASDVRTILDEPCPEVGVAPAPHTARPFASDHFGIGATLELFR
jgi:endonuclease/exonuclease/phosphatase family metal-dependent hydrolase